MTTGVCDGLPSGVERGAITSDRYCPWPAEVGAGGVGRRGGRSMPGVELLQSDRRTPLCPLAPFGLGSSETDAVGAVIHVLAPDKALGDP